MEGHMGTGKSSTIHGLAARLPDHVPCYFDCTTKVSGDITIPNIAHMDDGTGYVTYLTNEELGAHIDKPIILMVDEFGKAERDIKNSLLRLMLERKIGSYTLHPDSIVFATTNLGAENVGDMLPAHARNRITMLRLKKPTNMEWLTDFAIPNSLDPVLCGWAKDNPQLFHGFEDVHNPDDNPYIFHPQAPSSMQFVTPRSLHAASDILLQREHLDDHLLTSSLIGTIGARGAMDLMAYVKIGDQLPSLQSIKDDPLTATIPMSAAAVCMVVYKAAQTMGRDWVDAWMQYMVRLDSEAQGLFVMTARNDKYPHRSIVMTNSRFTTWAIDNGYMFAADKK
tara:strand:+ start:1334 stop:2347 length:1014 start_codon:yes stop_codon:yes gene_type:complete